MTQTFITISHLDDFGALDFMTPGTEVDLVKEPTSFDDESITVYTKRGSKCGYVANSCGRVARGTHSAGWVSRDFDTKASCVVRFVTEEIAIAELIREEAEKTEEN